MATRPNMAWVAEEIHEEILQELSAAIHRASTLEDELNMLGRDLDYAQEAHASTDAGAHDQLRLSLEACQERLAVLLRDAGAYPIPTAQPVKQAAAGGGVVPGKDLSRAAHCAPAGITEVLQCTYRRLHKLASAVTTYQSHCSQEASTVSNGHEHSCQPPAADTSDDALSTVHEVAS